MESPIERINKIKKLDTPTDKLKRFVKSIVKFIVKLMPIIKVILIATAFVLSYELSNRLAIIVENTDIIVKERIINITLVAMLFYMANYKKKH